MEFNDTGINGPDVSRWQRIPAQNGQPAKEINFQLMASFGFRFVIIKAGQYNYADPGFYYNWEAAENAGIPRGSYWFEDFRISPKVQAQTYWNLLKNDVGDGICAMDWESGSHRDLDSAYVFLNEFQQLSGLPDHKIAIYTGFPYWTNSYASSTQQREYFKKFILWEAWYPDDPENYSIVKVPHPWGNNDCTFWQNGTPSIGLQVGVQSKEIDHNKFNGDEEKFKLYFNSGVATNPPPIGDTMADWTASVKVNTTSLVVRNLPNGADTTNRVRGGDRLTGTGSAVLAGTHKWRNILTPFLGWVAEDYLVDLVESPAPPTSPTVVHEILTYDDGKVSIDGNPPF